MKLIPSRWVGINWIRTTPTARRPPSPDGYGLLPKKRILNMQVKGKGVMPESPEKEDWLAIMKALNHDGYETRWAWRPTFLTAP